MSARLLPSNALFLHIPRPGGIWVEYARHRSASKVVSVRELPLRAHPSLYGNRRKGSRGDCTLSILSSLCIDPNLRS